MLFVYLLILIMPLANHPIWGANAGGVTPFKVLGLICVLYGIITIASGHQVAAYLSTLPAKLFLGLYAIQTVSHFTKSLASSLQFDPFLSCTSFVLLFFVVLSVVNSYARLKGVLLSAVGAMAFGSLYVLREWQMFHAVDPSLRPGWVFGDSNYYSLCVLLVLPIAAVFAVRGTRAWSRWLARVAIVVMMGGFTLASSRGGLIGLAVASTYLIFRSAKHPVRTVLVFAALVVPLMVVAPNSPLNRLINPSYGDQEGTEIRKEYWSAGLEMIKANPVFGIGLGNFKPLVRQYAGYETKAQGIAHNTYVEIASELGLIAFLCFVGCLAASFITLEFCRRATRRSGDVRMEHLCVALQSVVIGFSIGAIFLSAEYQKLFWLMMFITMCVPRIVARRAIVLRPKRRRSISRVTLEAVTG